jgi:hypothetical protein
LPGLVRAAPVHPDQKIHTGQLRTRHRQQQATSGQPAVAFLDGADRTVQSIRDVQHPIDLGHRRDPA